MGIYTKPYGSASINDTTPSVSSVYSSSKTEELLDDKVDKIPLGTEDNLTTLDADGNIKDSGTKPSDFSASAHGHPSASMAIDTTNFGNTLDDTITNVQILADFIDDNLNYGARNFEHNQGISLPIWTIVHNLNINPAGITVVDSGGTNIVNFHITYIDVNNLTLEFSGATTGTAYLS